MKPMLKTLTAATCYLLITSTTPGHAGLTDGLEAYYPLDGNASDASGHGFTGTLINVSAAADRFGQPNSALSFQGTINSYVSLGAPESLKFTGDFTVTAWVNFTGGTENPRVVSYGEGFGYELLTSEASGSRHWIGHLATEKVLPTPTSEAASWYLVSLLRSGTTASVYVNANLIGSATISGTPVYSGDLMLGRKSIQDANEPRNYWGGSIDDVRFYSRALSTGELSQLYTAVPEPSSYASGFGIVLLGVGLWARKASKGKPQ